ncbi:hypothetical protein AB0E10_18860 [Streptomyces sp. NPDC048045]|uniref:hypothetical protein n=1 Tax=Streptomyces sp. NPDC048045 TaxID=3154710 RepID=UPI00344A19D6
MGERLSGDGVPVRHRHGHPGGSASGPWDGHDSATLEAVLGTALRAGRADPEAEQRALTAFRSAGHGDGVRRARTRRRDDWRPSGEKRFGRPARMTFGVVFASLTLGGVAVAAIGSAGSSSDGAGAGRGTARPSSAAAPHRPGATGSSASSGGPGRTGHPSTARDTEAHCRAYERVGKHGKALEATAWQRLVAAAGGKDKVAAYCSEQLTRATSGPNGTGRSGKDGAHSGNGTAGNSGDSGNGTSGTSGTSGTGNSGADHGSTHSPTGNGRSGGANGGADGGKSSGKHA